MLNIALFKYFYNLLQLIIIKVFRSKADSASSSAATLVNAQSCTGLLQASKASRKHLLMLDCIHLDLKEGQLVRLYHCELLIFS